MAKSSGGFAALVPNATTRFYNGKSQAKISRELSSVLDGLSKAFGGETIGVQSGYRSPSRNASVGGAKSSYHMKGMAADIDMTGWSTEKRQQAIEHLTNLGVGGFITYSAHPNMLHIDLRPRPPEMPPHFMHNKSVKNMAAAPEWFQDMAARAKPPSIAAQLPDTMQAPQSFAQAQAQEQALAQAFGSPSRALDVPQVSALAFNAPSRPVTPSPLAAINRISPPSRFPSVPVGQVTRSPLDAIPASLNAAPVGRVERAPLGPVGQFSAPARSLQHPTSVAPPSRLAAAPVGQVTRGPALAPAAPSVSKQGLVDAYGQYAASRVAADQATKLAEQYAQYQKMPGAIVPAKPLAHPISVPPAPVNVPPAPVLAPLMAPPAVVKDYSVAGIPAAPQAPRATAYDVYSGLADTALDNTGKNTVSRDAFGNTTVTNQYGATTAMTPGGYQSAYGGIPGGSLPSLPGIKGPDMGKFGQAVKGALPGIGGGLLGTAVAGPLGGMIGAALAKAVTQPGGLLSGVKSFDTDYFGTLNAARPQAGGAFPSAPRAAPGTSSGFRSSGERSAAYSRSPGAAANIDAGRTGLY